MPLVSTLDLLKSARRGHYAVGAFNIDNLDMIKAVAAAAEEMNLPAIIQTTYTTVNHAGASALSAMVRAVASESTAVLALHLDHGDSFNICCEAADKGYSSVMIDGSKLSLEDNIALTAKVADYAHAKGVWVEGELGRVGGTEDELTSDSQYTDVCECREFVQETGVDFVAIGVGTAHGIYIGEPCINVSRIKEIFDAVDIPLVLHGASGLSGEIITDCIKAGISKINFATELRIAYTGGVRDALSDPKLFDPKKFQAEGRKRVFDTVIAKMKLISAI